MIHSVYNLFFPKSIEEKKCEQNHDTDRLEEQLEWVHFHGNEFSLWTRGGKTFLLLLHYNLGRKLILPHNTLLWSNLLWARPDFSPQEFSFPVRDYSETSLSDPSEKRPTSLERPTRLPPTELPLKQCNKNLLEATTSELSTTATSLGPSTLEP